MMAKKKKVIWGVNWGIVGFGALMFLGGTTWAILYLWATEWRVYDIMAFSVGFLGFLIMLIGLMGKQGVW